MPPSLSPAPVTKALHCAQALLALLSGAEQVDDIEATLRQHLGKGWSLVSAASYLTGKSARQAIEREESRLSARHLAEYQQAVEFAIWLCVSPDAPAPWSGAAHVRELRQRIGSRR